MSVPPLRVVLSPGLNEWSTAAKADPSLRAKFKKVAKAIEFDAQSRSVISGFHTHQMRHLAGYDGRQDLELVRRKPTPGAWRM